MTTEKLRDAIALAVHRNVPDGTPDGVADAILALPEMVAAMGVVEAAHELASNLAQARQRGYLGDDEMGLVAAVDAYDKAVKG